MKIRVVRYKKTDSYWCVQKYMETMQLNGWVTVLAGSLSDCTLYATALENKTIKLDKNGCEVIYEEELWYVK